MMKKNKRKSSIKAGMNYMLAGTGNDIIKYCWQNIVLVVCLMLLLLTIGMIIFNKCNKTNNDVKAKGAVQTVSAVTEKNEKRAYLTFDDGPSIYSDELLDILAENNVKATFFVIGRDETYYDIYRRIVDEGHTLALHSYSHDYEKIYSSTDNFVNDIEELRNLLYDVTGVECKYYRFPGGSSNTVSAVPMSDLVSCVYDLGLEYFDWNSLNGDSVSRDLPPEQLVDNIMQDALKYDDTIILMHDLGDRHTTIESLELLINRLRDEGYILLPIDENTPSIKHSLS
jgi:peptidoglycan/xylan/chitin deacetylase (PgdA/CDA1 family)